ncbi:MAG: hypothetical protein ACE5R4_14665 [Armatimonadota bacterium]
MHIDAAGLHYSKLNKMVRDAVAAGERHFELVNVNGQRYIGDGIDEEVTIDIHGTPGNDLGAFMNGPHITVHGNAQDGVANTMNRGEIIVHGHAGDVIGYGMRGGRVLVRGDVGYRVGIHMKAYKGHVPVIISGGCAGDFFGEYMAGGSLILLGLDRNGRPLVGDYCATGIHGGEIILRGHFDEFNIATEHARIAPLPDDQRQSLQNHLGPFCQAFELDLEAILDDSFHRLTPISHRPFGGNYAT